MEIQVSFLPLTVFLITSSLFLLLLVVPRTRRGNIHLPPGPWKLPIIGSMHHLLFNSGLLPHDALARLSRRYGPLMHMQFGEISAIIVSSPQMVEKVLKTFDDTFSSRPRLLPSRVTSYPNEDIMFVPCGPYWRQMRKICHMELLNAKNVRSFSSIREDEVMQVISSIRDERRAPINITDKIFSMTAAITARAAFGKRCKDHDAVIKHIRDGAQLAAGFDVSDMFPSLKILHPLSGLKPKLVSAQKELDAAMERIVVRHQENLASSGRGNGDSGSEDLVDVLLRHQMNGDLQCPITTNGIKAVIMDIIGAGTDASSNTIVWAMAEVMKNREVREKAQDELRKAFKGKEIIGENDIQSLKYLKLLIKETLRLHTPVPLTIPRESIEQCDIDGYTIPNKTIAMVNVWAMGRDPKIWKEPDRFLPERFEASLDDFRGTNFHYIPFGAGRRVCPGISFAIANIEYPLAQLLYQYDWNLPDGMKPEDLDMTERFGLTAGRNNDLYLVATPYAPPIPPFKD